MVWRNHIYNIIINAFGPVKELAPHLHQLGYRWAALSKGCQVQLAGSNAGFCTWVEGRCLGHEGALIGCQTVCIKVIPMVMR